jgi:hypothetical protein
MFIILGIKPNQRGSMKVYQVECRAIITLAASDMQEAVLRSSGIIKENPHLLRVRGVHEITLETAWKDSSQKSLENDSIRERQSLPLAA